MAVDMPPATQRSTQHQVSQPQPQPLVKNVVGISKKISSTHFVLALPFVKRVGQSGIHVIMYSKQ